MTTSRPDNFPNYGVPWLIAEMVEGFTVLSYCPIEMTWEDTYVGVIQLDNPDTPSAEIEFLYDGVRQLKITHWGWLRNRILEQDEWGVISEVNYSILESEDLDQLANYLRETLKDHNVYFQYPSKPKS